MSATPDALVELHDVRLLFGAVRALDGLDLTVRRGDALGLLGANGAGKTSTLRVLMGLTHPTGGRVRLFGERPGPAQQRRLGFVPEQRGLYEDVGVGRILEHFARLHGLSRAEAQDATRAWLERVGLGNRGAARSGELSKGQQQCVQIGVALLHRPDLLVLDEPFSGLDVYSQELLHEVLAEERARGTTMIVSTHEIEHAERLCSRVAIVSKGRVIEDAGTLELLAREGEGEVRVRMRGDASAWRDVEGVAAVHGTDVDLRLRLADGAQPTDVLRRGLERGLGVESFARVTPSLREVVLALTSGDWGDAA